MNVAILYRRAMQTLAEHRAVLLFLVAMFVFRSAWADWVSVPSGSMNPTILEGDRVLVDKHVYGLRVPFTRTHLTRGADPQRGEIIVFDSPVNGTSLIKRVVAVPGDTVALDGERLIVNNRVAHYSPGDQTEVATLLEPTRAQAPIVAVEAGLSPAHPILLLPGRIAAATTRPMTVPPGAYFVLGDNRDNSADSRYIGFIPRNNIVGRAGRIVISFDPEHAYLPRSQRILLPLR